MGVSENSGTPKSSIILIGFSIINHPFWGTPIFGNTHIDQLILEIGSFWGSTQNVKMFRSEKGGTVDPKRRLSFTTFIATSSVRCIEDVIM